MWRGEGFLVRQGEVGWCEEGLGVAWYGFLGEATCGMVWQGEVR